MVKAQWQSVSLTYTRADGWTGTSDIDEITDVVVARLNDATPRAAYGYLPEVTNAMAILTEALGPNGWEILSHDIEPIDPGVVY